MDSLSKDTALYASDHATDKTGERKHEYDRGKDFALGE